MKRLLFCLVLICLLPVSVFAQDTDEDTQEPALPVIPYYTTLQAGRQFNIPIPAGWEVDDSHDDYLQLTNPATDGVFYVMKLVNADGIGTAIHAFAPEFVGIAPHTQSQITFDGLTWTIELLDSAEGANLSVYSQVRDNATYVIAYKNPNPDFDFYVLASQAQNLNTPISINDVLNQLDDSFEGTLVDSQPLTYGVALWQRNTFDTEAEPILTLHQERAGSVYAVIQRGDSDSIDTVNRAFYTIIFGFFVTPQNTGYLWLGLGATLGIILLLIFSIYLRYRNAEKDLTLIEQLEAD